MPHAPAPRRSLAVHLLHIGLFSAALSTIATIVAADVLAAEPEALAIDWIEALEGEEPDEPAPTRFAAAIQIPEAAAREPAPAPAEAAEIAELAVKPAAKRKKRKRSPFGRFEGY